MNRDIPPEERARRIRTAALALRGMTDRLFVAVDGEGAHDLRAVRRLATKIGSRAVDLVRMTEAPAVEKRVAVVKGGEA